MSDDRPKLDVEQLDIAAECAVLMMVMRGAWATLPEELGREVRERAPFVKALVRLAKAHPEEALTLWVIALGEPMPFDQPPVGKPGDVG